MPLEVCTKVSTKLTKYPSKSYVYRSPVSSLHVYYYNSLLYLLMLIVVAKIMLLVSGTSIAVHTPVYNGLTMSSNFLYGESV